MSLAVDRPDATSLLGGPDTPGNAVLRAETGFPERLVIETPRDRGARSHH